MRCGLLGTGPWAEGTHGPALRKHPDVELVGVWGRRPEAAARLAERLETRPFDDPDALFARCDAVAVALPPDVQAPLAARAAAAGCHLLLDKPVATTGDAAREVAEAVDRSGVASVVFFTLRFAGDSAAWVEEQTATGGWLTGRADWLSPVFGGGESPYAASPWRRERGALWDIGPHALSMLLPPLGDVADLGEVRAARGPGDTVHLVLRHVSGASSAVTVSHSVPPRAAGVAVELRGASGVATLPPRGEGPDGGPVPAFGRAVDALGTAAGGGPAHPCDVHFGRRVTDILTAAEQALDTRR